MSILSNRTERKSIKILAKTLRFFSNTDLLFVINEDAFKAKEAENILLGIIENNGYKVNKPNLIDPCCRFSSDHIWHVPSGFYNRNYIGEYWSTKLVYPLYRPTEFFEIKIT